MVIFKGSLDCPYDEHLSTAVNKFCTYFNAADQTTKRPFFSLDGHYIDNHNSRQNPQDFSTAYDLDV